MKRCPFISLCSAIFILLIIYCEACAASSEYIHPDWWGVELKDPSGNNNLVVGAGLYTRQGSFYIMCYYYPDNKRRKTYLYDFFNDKIVAEWTQDRATDEYLAKADGLTTREYTNKYGYVTRFELNLDFGTNKGRSDFLFDSISTTTSHCDAPWGYGFIMKSANSTSEYKKQFIHINKSKMKLITSDECTIMDGRKQASIYSESCIVHVLSLDDGTYLLQTFEDPYLIRIRPDATSPFVDSRNDLFLVDFDWMQNVYDEIFENVLHERNKPPFQGPIYLLENIDLRISERLRALKRKGVSQ